MFSPQHGCPSLPHTFIPFVQPPIVHVPSVALQAPPFGMQRFQGNFLRLQSQQPPSLQTLPAQHVVARAAA